MRYILIILILLFTSQDVSAAKLAIIIDDIGYRQSDEEVLSLPSNITLSVLPHTPLGKSLAATAYRKGHEIMLHLPMQALNGKAIGPGALTNSMSEQEFKSQLAASLDSIPFASGANNHMGSLLTQLDEPMQWVMEGLRQRNIYFVDSITTKFTKAGSTANRLGVPLLKRQLFLDNDTSAAALEEQFQRVIGLTRKQGHLLVIAHPYPETLAFLKENLHRLEGANIELVQISSLLQTRLAQKSPTPRILLQD